MLRVCALGALAGAARSMRTDHSKEIPCVDDMDATYGEGYCAQRLTYCSDYKFWVNCRKACKKCGGDGAASGARCVFGYEPVCSKTAAGAVTQHVHGCHDDDKKYFFRKYDYGLVSFHREYTDSFCDRDPALVGAGVETTIQCSKSKRMCKPHLDLNGEVLFYHHEDKTHAGRKYELQPGLSSGAAHRGWDLDRSGYFTPEWSKTVEQGPQEYCQATNLLLNFSGMGDTGDYYGEAWQEWMGNYPINFTSLCKPRWNRDNTNNAPYASYSWGKTLSQTKQGTPAEHGACSTSDLTHVPKVMVVDNEHLNYFHQYCSWITTWLSIHVRGWVRCHPHTTPC